jgi:pantoate--beta-alanine ligase
VTIFVNPIQFGPGEDFKAYPRGLRRDLALLAPLGVDMVFAPSAQAMYPAGFSSKVSVAGGLAAVFEGARRPGHFDGVATVVAKLFCLAGGGKAFFGRKDYQQLQVVRRMALDLNLGVKVVACPTVRAADGLALSSRNAYLSPAQRLAAPGLYQALRLARACLLRGQSPAAARSSALAALRQKKDFRVDYIGIADADTLGRPRRGGRTVVLGAAFLGKTRLIDNL